MSRVISVCVVSTRENCIERACAATGGSITRDTCIVRLPNQPPRFAGTMRMGGVSGDMNVHQVTGFHCANCEGKSYLGPAYGGKIFDTGDPARRDLEETTSHVRTWIEHLISPI